MGAERGSRGLATRRVAQDQLEVEERQEPDAGGGPMPGRGRPASGRSPRPWWRGGPHGRPRRGCVFGRVLSGSAEKTFPTARENMNAVVIHDSRLVPLSPENRAPSPAWL